MKIFRLLTLVLCMMVISCTNDQFRFSWIKFKIQANNNPFPVSLGTAALKSSTLTDGSFTWDTCLMVVSKIDLQAEKQQEEDYNDSTDIDQEEDYNDSTDIDQEEDYNDSTDIDQEEDYNDSADIDQEGDYNDTTGIDFEWTGPKIVDLFNLNSVVGEISLLPGIYDEISIKIESFKSDAGSSPVFYLSGTYPDSTGAEKRINVIINEDFEIKVNNIDTLYAVYDYTSVIQLNLALLMSDIHQSDLDSAELTNGKLVISSTSNVTLYNKIMNNLLECEDSELEQEGKY
jgi:hypothetical protein